MGYMQIKEVLKDTSVMICGRIDNAENNVEKMAGMLEYNKSVLSACRGVVLVLNRDPAVPEDDVTAIFNLYKQTFKDCYLLQPHPVGMGHQVGHVTLDKTGYLFAKNNIGTGYTMKLCNDIMLSEKFLDLEVEKSDLYYIPSVGINHIADKWNEVKNISSLTSGYEDLMYNYQSWFFIATNNTPVLYESDEEVERVFRMWDVKSDVKQSRVLSAEHSLTKWSVQNKLTRYSLYSSQEFDNYCKYVMSHRIGDGSLKNIMIEPHGITHTHFVNQPFSQMFL